MTEHKLSAGVLRPLRTLDPDGPLDDLEWLDEAVGAARVVAIGESAHYHAESYQLRHRVLRYLVERHGFDAYALESGFVESRRADEWIGGGPGDLGAVLAGGLTSLMGLWREMRAQLEWLRDQPRPVTFTGIDLPGSNASLLPGLDAVLGYLSRADPSFQVDPAIRETATTFAAPSAFSAPATIAAYVALPPATRDALTAGLADLTARLTSSRPDLVGRTSTEEYDHAVRCARLTVTLDAVARALARGDQPAMLTMRDAAIADTVEWILDRHDRVLVAAHNGHVQRVPGTMPGLPPFPTMGVHLADRLGDGYRVIGMTTGTGQTLNTGPDFYTGRLFTDLPAPDPGSLDALLAASSDEPFAVNLRTLPKDDADAVRGARRQRYGGYYAELDPMTAYDILIHLPHVTAATPDPEAVAASPAEVRVAFEEQR